MSKIVKKLIKSAPEIDLDLKTNYKKIRKVQETIRNPRLKALYKNWNYKIIATDEYEIPVRIFYPKNKEGVYPLIIYFHGGGWVSGNINTYTKVCHNLAQKTNHIVLSVDYRLAPENKFPTGLMDCYQVVQFVLKNINDLKINLDDVTIMGDSAGGNVAAAISLMARDKKGLVPKRQILIYPALISQHEKYIKKYPSIRENEKNIFLSLKDIDDYISLYKKNDWDLRNPYMSPLLARKFKNQPDTLIISAELDILRDEAEEYGKKLLEAGNYVEIVRMLEVGHGYFSIILNTDSIKKTYEIINDFLGSDKSERK